jgi:hypothetical protein
MLISVGNCDAPIDQMLISVPLQSPYSMLCFDGKKLLLTHGHNMEEKALEELAMRWKVDILVTGHTHVKDIKILPGLLHVNPGSCSLPKDGIPSVALIDGKEVHLIDLNTGQSIKSESLD